MERYVIEGRQRLSGRVRMSGAKNAVLPIMAATVLCGGPCKIIDAPNLKDVQVMSGILRRLGASVSRQTTPDGRPCLLVDGSGLGDHEVPEDLMREMRSSIFLMGPLLGRLRRVRVSYPGGCAIGPRPIDLHLRGLQALGAIIRERHGYIYAEVSNLKGAEVHLDFPSVGATENIMMAAVMAKGPTVIRNAAKEPEIVDLQNFLNGMGARIRGAGMDVIRIDGVDSLSGVDYPVIPDRIETGTFMAAACITGGEICIENCIPEHVESITAKLRETGADIREEKDRMFVRGPARPRAVDFKTLPYPGFPTDMQPQAMALMCVSEGTSVITETIFESRFKQAEELKRMGAIIKTEGRSAVIKGRETLYGAHVEAFDLRGGASLTLAGLVAEGVTTIEGIQHIERGYDGFEENLTRLGANIRRVKEDH
ncbi:MAG: UDP-N-acetylglucosamine 1-carboxyvinyltransferase [Firmicutes bacterium]|nr:UDP-N-acetylglucosamine 1-carboxyvinyltransferase [Bacillota bacterium]